MVANEKKPAEQCHRYLYHLNISLSHRYLYYLNIFAKSIFTCHFSFYSNQGSHQCKCDKEGNRNSRPGFVSESHVMFAAAGINTPASGYHSVWHKAQNLRGLLNFRTALTRADLGCGQGWNLFASPHPGFLGMLGTHGARFSTSNSYRVKPEMFWS